MNNESGFNWATLDNWGASQSKTMIVRPVSAAWPTDFFPCYTVQTSAIPVQYCTDRFLSQNSKLLSTRCEILLYIVFTLNQVLKH